MTSFAAGDKRYRQFACMTGFYLEAFTSWSRYWRITEGISLLWRDLFQLARLQLRTSDSNSSKLAATCPTERKRR